MIPEVLPNEALASSSFSLPHSLFLLRPGAGRLTPRHLYNLLPPLLEALSDYSARTFLIALGVSDSPSPLYFSP